MDQPKQSLPRPEQADKVNGQQPRQEKVQQPSEVIRAANITKKNANSIDAPVCLKDCKRSRVLVSTLSGTSTCRLFVGMCQEGDVVILLCVEVAVTLPFSVLRLCIKVRLCNICDIYIYTKILYRLYASSELVHCALFLRE